MANVCNTLKLSVHCSLQVKEFAFHLRGLHLQTRKAILLSEDGEKASHDISGYHYRRFSYHKMSRCVRRFEGSILRNVGNCRPKDTASHLRRLISQLTSLFTQQAPTQYNTLLVRHTRSIVDEYSIVYLYNSWWKWERGVKARLL